MKVLEKKFFFFKNFFLCVFSQLINTTHNSSSKQARWFKRCKYTQCWISRGNFRKKTQSLCDEMARGKESISHVFVPPLKQPPFLEIRKKRLKNKVDLVAVRCGQAKRRCLFPENQEKIFQFCVVEVEKFCQFV